MTDKETIADMLKRAKISFSEYATWIETELTPEEEKTDKLPVVFTFNRSGKLDDVEAVT